LLEYTLYLLCDLAKQIAVGFMAHGIAPFQADKAEALEDQGRRLCVYKGAG